jgi:2-dehydro-3-deoxyphosphogluconate aldolase/(4S)-4-hydroxy-2-oxoglutarate aldolase
VDYCLDNQVPVFPGISGTGEIEQAISRGLEVVKFFPAEALGGVPMLKALGGPYRTLRFMPTGGISLANLDSYLALPQVVACGGSWLVPRDRLAAGDYEGIAANVAKTMRAILGLSIRDGVAEIDVKYPARTRAYLERAGAAAQEHDQAIEIGAKSIILRG